jgi:membrane protease YdiL (CAAX protease family)
VISQGYTLCTWESSGRGEIVLDIAIIFMTPLMLVLIGVAIARFRHLSWRDDIGFKPVAARQIALWGVGFLALVLTGEIVSRMAGLESQAGTWRTKYDALDIAVRIVAVGLVYPVAEEFFFRGAMLGFFNRRFGAVAAVIFSSAAFALVHVQYEWQGMLLIAADAIFFAVSRLRTGSLYPAILFHICGNSYAIWERIYG